MKTRSTKGPRPFQLRLLAYEHAYYIERIVKLERAVSRKPRVLQIELIGVGEIPADSALLIRSILLARSPKTRVITNARSSLQGGSLLVWLLGDCRIIRDDAWVFFKRNPLADEDPVEVYAGMGESEQRYKDSYSSFDPEDADYARVLELINEFLPVKELAGRLIGVPMLRQFGLVENEKVDHFLAAAFARSESPNALADAERVRQNDKRPPLRPVRR